MIALSHPWLRLTATQRATNLRGIAAARAALHAARDPFPEVTARHDVDQALATTGRGRP